MIDVKRVLVVLTVAAVAAVFTTLPLDAAEVQRGVKAQQFSRWDLDGNGKLTPEEWRGTSPFEEADADGDGIVTPAELAAVPAAGFSQPRPKVARPGGAESETDEWTENLYDWQGSSSRTRYTDEDGWLKDARSSSPARFWDMDGDGKVSRQEWKGEAAEWGRHDRDADGFVTPEEYSAASAVANSEPVTEARHADDKAAEVDSRTADSQRGEEMKTWSPPQGQAVDFTGRPGAPTVETLREVDSDGVPVEEDDGEGEGEPESD